MYLTVKQAAEKLQVCKKTIFRRIKDGSLPCIRLGNKTIRIKEEDFQKYIESKREQ